VITQQHRVKKRRIRLAEERICSIETSVLIKLTCKEEKTKRGSTRVDLAKSVQDSERTEKRKCKD
jgi:hypothetical protein